MFFEVEKAFWQLVENSLVPLTLLYKEGGGFVKWERHVLL